MLDLLTYSLLLMLGSWEFHLGGQGMGSEMGWHWGFDYEIGQGLEVE